MWFQKGMILIQGRKRAALSTTFDGNDYPAMMIIIINGDVCDTSVQLIRVMRGSHIFSQLRGFGVILHLIDISLFFQLRCAN